MVTTILLLVIIVQMVFNIWAIFKNYKLSSELEMMTDTKEYYVGLSRYKTDTVDRLSKNLKDKDEIISTQKIWLSGKEKSISTMLEMLNDYHQWAEDCETILFDYYDID